LLYGALCYGLFIATAVYAMGFIGNIVVPKSIDSAPVAPIGKSLLIDVTLLAAFALQHSGMARPAFKRWLIHVIPPAVERSTYVLMASATLALLMWQWAPLGGVVWHVTTSWAATALTGLYFASWGLLLYATCLIDHFGRYGLRQSLHAFQGRPLPDLPFRTPALYRLVRHPVCVGWLGISWFTPTMSITHLVFAVAASLYILIGVKLEERDLEAAHPEYTQYRRKVPALFPSFRRRLARSAEIKLT
jgi:protein-S-isoprenylcysteine O-methyltransferase Ste14